MQTQGKERAFNLGPFRIKHFRPGEEIMIQAHRKIAVIAAVVFVACAVGLYLIGINIFDENKLSEVLGLAIVGLLCIAGLLTCPILFVKALLQKVHLLPGYGLNVTQLKGLRKVEAHYHDEEMTPPDFSMPIVIDFEVKQSSDDRRRHFLIHIYCYYKGDKTMLMTQGVRSEEVMYRTLKALDELLNSFKTFYDDLYAPQAKQEYEEKLEENPSLITPRLERAAELFNRWEFDAAIEVYREAISLSDDQRDQADYLQLIARCHIGKRDFREAIKVCYESLELNRTNLMTYQRLSDAHDGLYEHDKAEEVRAIARKVAASQD